MLPAKGEAAWVLRGSAPWLSPSPCTVKNTATPPDRREEGVFSLFQLLDPHSHQSQEASWPPSSPGHSRHGEKRAAQGSRAPQGEGKRGRWEQGRG